MSKLVLVEFNLDVYYGCLNGLFICPKKDLNKLIGKEIYYGSVAGKHSEVYGELEKDEVKIITDDQEEIIKIAKLFKEEIVDGHATLLGKNPFNYYEEEEE
jgi:hypothetical protein